MVPSELLAVHRLGDVEVLLPGFRRLQSCFLQHIGAIVEHVEVAIERDEKDLPVVCRREIAEEGRNVVPFDVLILGDAGSQFFEIAAGHIVDHPLRREDRGVDRIGAARPVREHFLVEVGEWNRDDIDLGPGQLLEVRRAPLQRLLDRAGLRHQVHRDAVKLSRLRAYRRGKREYRAGDRRRNGESLCHVQISSQSRP